MPLIKKKFYWSSTGQKTDRKWGFVIKSGLFEMLHTLLLFMGLKNGKFTRRRSFLGTDLATAAPISLLTPSQIPQRRILI